MLDIKYIKENPEEVIARLAKKGKDGKNDIEMLSTVGCGIAMGNADEEVKKYAKEVTDTVHNDGVAIGIEKYILS